MNLLQRYLEIRGIRLTTLAAETGYGKDTVYKIVAGARYKTKGGTTRIRKSPHVRRAIADYLGVPVDYLWGPSSSRHLKQMIRKEIERKAEVTARVKAKALAVRYLEEIQESQAA
jgi:lambda repressor-like predicted transcriptional regulator